MTQKILDVNITGLIKYTNALEKLHENDVPRVVASTLSKVAMDVKQKTMPKSARKAFTQRSNNFFKVTSNVQFAKRQSNVNSIHSIVGFRSDKAKANKYAVKELEVQEYGGKIEKRSFVPLTNARIAKDINRRVKKQNRISTLVFVKAKNARGVNKGQRFIKSVHFAGRGGYVLSEDGILWRVNSLRKNKRGGMNLTAMYSFKDGRAVRVNNTNFMEFASRQSMKKMGAIFIAEAKTQINYRLSK